MSINTMKFIIALSMVALAAGYTTLDDSLNFQKLMEYPEEFKRFIFCIIDKGECPKPYDAFRAVAEEAIRGACSKCTDYQKHTLYLFLTETQKHYPNFYQDFQSKYDPEGVYLPVTLATVSQYRDLTMPTPQENNSI